MDSLLQEFLPDRIRRTKERLKAIQESSPAKTEWLAHCMGISASRLYQMLSPNNTGDRFPLDNLEIFITETGDFGALDDIEARLGRVAFAQPQPLESFEEISRHITRVFREASSACQAVIDSVDSGSIGGSEITWDEFKQIQEEIRKAHQQLAALEEAARKKSQKHPSWPVRLVQKLGIGRGSTRQ